MQLVCIGHNFIYNMLVAIGTACSIYFNFQKYVP